MAKAGERGVVVEFVFFCPFYEDAMWNVSPMKATIQGPVIRPPSGSGGRTLRTRARTQR